MFSGSARRSSLRPKTPGRTPRPSRFSVGQGSEWATPAGVPRRFTDSEVSTDQVIGGGAEETPTISRPLVNGNVDQDRGLLGQNARTSSGAFGGNGFANPTNPSYSRPIDGEHRGVRLAALEHAGDLQTAEKAANRLAPRDAPVESTGVGVLTLRAQTMDEARFHGRRTVIEEVEERAVVVVPAQGNEEEVWRRFRGAGTLDEEMLVRREKEELQRRLGDMQKELADYRYNLGVLILEHKKCGPRNEELEDALRRTQEELHNEGRALRLALDDAAGREDALRGSLKMERSALADLTQSLKEMHVKLEAAEATSRERLTKAGQLEADTSQERKHAEELARKSSRELKAAQQLEAGVKVREGELDGKLRGMQEREAELVTREARLRQSEKEVKAAEGDVRDREFALVDQRKAMEKELEKGRRGNEQAKLEGESRIEALRTSVEEEREKMRKEMREAKEVAEQGFSAREKGVTAKEADAARKQEALQASLREAEDKQRALSVRQQELEEREKLLGEEKHRMLLKEADLLDQEGTLAEERARLAEQETEWQRIETKLETRAEELEAKEAAVQARDADLESALKESMTRESALQEKEAAALKQEADLQARQENLAQLQKQIDERLEAVEKERVALEKQEAETEAERHRLQMHSEELERKATQLEERTTVLEAQGVELYAKEQALIAREQQVALRESGTAKDLQERWEALEVRQKETEADLAKQLKQLQSEKTKAAALLKKSQAQVDEERESVRKELQETRAALETEFQTKVLKIQEKLSQRLMVSETERQKAVDSEVEKRVKELTQEFEVKLEEKLALILAERFAEVDGDVEKRVEERVKDLTQEFESKLAKKLACKLAERFAEVDGDVEKRVEERVKERVNGLEEQHQLEVERRVEEAVQKEVKGQVKERVKEAVQKVKEETSAKTEREKENAVQKALKAAEKKAESERKAAVTRALEEARTQFELVKVSAVQDARAEFEVEKETAVQKALESVRAQAALDREIAVAEAKAKLEHEKDVAIQSSLVLAERTAENGKRTAVARAVEEAKAEFEQQKENVLQDARERFEVEKESAIQKALESAESKAALERQIADAEARANLEREKEVAVQRALEEVEGMAEDERKVAVAKAREEARARVELEKSRAVEKALQEAENAKTAAVTKAIEEVKLDSEQQKAIAVQKALQEAEGEKSAAVAKAIEEARTDFQQEKETVVRNAVKAVETQLESEKNAAVGNAREEAKATFEREKESAVRKAVEETEKKAENEKKAAIAAAVNDAVKAEETRLAGKERAVVEEQRESEVGSEELGNGEQLERANLSQAAAKEEVPKRGWLGMLSPRRSIRTRQAAAEILAVRFEDGKAAVEEENVAVELLPVSFAPVETTPGDVGPVLTEAVSMETADVNALGTPIPSKPSGKRKISEPSSNERPLKQRKSGRRKGEKLEAEETEAGRGPVEALGAAVTAVGRAADAVTGPFGFVLDDTDLGFEPGSTETQAERDHGVKKPSWNLWPGFLSPRKSKPSEESRDVADTAPEDIPLPEEGVELGTEATPLGEERTKEAVMGGQIEGQTTYPLVEPAGGWDQPVGSVSQGTTSEIDLRSVESGAVGGPPSLFAKTPNTRLGRKTSHTPKPSQTPKPSRTPKPVLPAVRASSRLRERALSSDLAGSLEPPTASQLPALAEVHGRGSPGMGPTEGLPASETEDASPGLRKHRSLTPEEQAKLDRLLESFEAEEQAIAIEEAVLSPPSPAVLSPLTPVDTAPSLVSDTNPGLLTPNTSNPVLEPAAGGLEPLTSESTLKEQAVTPGLESIKGVVKRKSGGGRSVERLKREDALRLRAAKASERPSGTFLTEAELAKEQDLPDDEDIEETPAELQVVDAEPIEGLPVSDSPPVVKTTLPPKTPKSVFGKLMAAFGSARSPASEERQEGSLEADGGTYKSQVKELRSIVGDLVSAADRDDEMGGSERLEIEPPEVEEQSEGGLERLEFGTPEGSERELGFGFPLGEGGGLEQGGFGSVMKRALEGAGTVVEAAVTEGQQLGGAVLRKTRVAAFDLNEIADDFAGAPADDVAAEVADDVIALGSAAGQVADKLTGNIGEALAPETLEEGGLNTAVTLGGSAVGTGVETVVGTLKSAAKGVRAGLRRGSSREPTPSYGTAIEGGAPTPSRGFKSLAEVGGGNETQGLQRRGSKRKAAQSESKGKQVSEKVSETEPETGDEGASKRTRVKKRVEGGQAGDDAGLVDPRVVDFAAKFDGGATFDGGEEEELEAGGSEAVRRRKRSKSAVDPRDGEDVSAGLRRYNLRKSTLVKMHVWEPRAADFDTGADEEGIHTRTGVASTPRNLRRSVFDGDNPFLEDKAPGNPHSLEEIRTPRSARGGRGAGGAAVPPDEEAEQANAGWRWLGFLGW